MPPKKQKQKKKAGRKGGRGFDNVDEATFPRLIRGAGNIAGGFTSVWSKAVAQPDVMVVKMRYETTSAFTSTSGAASYVQIKGNSIYRPYVGNTDSVGGYARMYADYEYAGVMASKVTVRLWGGVTGQDEPFRIILIPCTSSQYSAYSGFSNVAQLWDVPHARQALFSPGGVLPTLTSGASNAQILLGQSKETGSELAISASGTWISQTGADPSQLWYYLIGYQNMAGTTTTNQQAQVSIEYEVKFLRPVATPVQLTNKHGNDCSTCTEAEKKEMLQQLREWRARTKVPCQDRVAGEWKWGDRSEVVETKAKAGVTRQAAVAGAKESPDVEEDDEALFHSARLLSRKFQGLSLTQVGSGAGFNS